MEISVAEQEPKIGQEVVHNGVKCAVSYNPFTREDDLGWLYKHPHNETIFWREMWPCDLYQPERLNEKTIKETHET